MCVISDTPKYVGRGEGNGSMGVLDRVQGIG